ncbi:MAG: AAA family ATPase [Candidatus Omnitrophica bacterium]|nr:AAA family ATPase [Candidatus Omnitrophota bacterium]HXK95195.1 AAA family ATPase [bacterium]
MFPQSKIQSLRIQGYRPFRDFSAHFDALEVLVGANGSGKSSLFEFLKFLRDSVHVDIPPEIIAGSIGQQIFHVPGPQRFWWSIDIDTGFRIKETGEINPIRYQGELMGPVGRTHISFERVIYAKPFKGHKTSYRFMNIRERQGVIQDPEIKRFAKQNIELKRPNQLALSTISNPMMVTLYNLREYIRNWRFYSSFNIANDKIRKSVPIEQEPILHEDAGNLSSVLHYLMTEHPSLFDDLQQHLRAAIPGFKSLTVKARGGPGEVITFCQEEGVGNELSLADLSDGVLRLICWMVLCVHPNPPTLICIDEPDQGVHPRTLPLLAGLFEKACQKTQLFLATHASYFLMQFDISRIAVFRKENGETVFRKPKNSKTLCENLSDFGQEEIEIMHKSDELEKIA